MYGSSDPIPPQRPDASAIDAIVRDLTEGLPIRFFSLLPEFPYPGWVYVDYGLADRTFAVTLSPEEPLFALFFYSRAGVDLDEVTPVLLTPDVLITFLPECDADQLARVLRTLTTRLYDMHRVASSATEPVLDTMGEPGSRLLRANLPGQGL